MSKICKRRKKLASRLAMSQRSVPYKDFLNCVHRFFLWRQGQFKGFSVFPIYGNHDNPSFDNFLNCHSTEDFPDICFLFYSLTTFRNWLFMWVIPLWIIVFQWLLKIQCQEKPGFHRVTLFFNILFSILSPSCLLLRFKCLSCLTATNLNYISNCSAIMHYV